MRDGNISALFDPSIKSVNPYPISSSGWNKKSIFNSTELPICSATPIPMPSQLIAVPWSEHVLYPSSFLGWLSEGEKNSCNCSACLLVCPGVFHTHQKPSNTLVLFSRTWKKKIRKVCDKPYENGGLLKWAYIGVATEERSGRIQLSYPQFGSSPGASMHTESNRSAAPSKWASWAGESGLGNIWGKQMRGQRIQ